MISFLIVLLMASCAVNPVTHEREFLIFSEEEEVRIGEKSHRSVLEEFGYYRDRELQRYVLEVGGRIARVSHRNYLPHHFTVTDSAVINAFALPGGYIYVNRGLLAYLNNEAQLAGVLGHEAGHIAARHGVKKYQQVLGAQLILAGVAMATKSRGIVLGTNLLIGAILQGYSRRDEYQADRLGTLYMYRAGYDPFQMARFLEVLRGLERREPSLVEQIFSSHPLTSERVKRVEAWAEELTGGRRRGLVVKANRYLSHLDGLVFGPGERDGVIEGEVFRNRYFRFQVRVPEGWKMRRGERMGSVEAQDPRRRFLLQAIPMEFPAPLRPEEVARRVEKGSGWLRLGAARGRSKGLPALMVEYLIRERAIRMRVAYITRGRTAFLLALIAPQKAFPQGRGFFNLFLHSFRPLSAKEAQRIPLYRLKVYMARVGDTYPAISSRFYGTPRYAEEIQLFNGLGDHPIPPPGRLLKIKPRALLAQKSK